MCPLHQALSDEKLRGVLSQRMNIPLEKVGCEGCRAANGHPPVLGEPCATYLCTKEKGVEFCSECTDFPCLKLMPCADKADSLPHNLKVYSLTLRKLKGEQTWNQLIGQLYSLYHRGKMVIGKGPASQN